MVGYTVTILEADNTQEEKSILAALKAHNVSQVGDSKSRALTIAFKSPNSEIIAGLAGRTTWNWLFVSLLWVHEAHRSSSLGKELLHLAEDEARKRGCSDAYLDTFSERALKFYLSVGYLKFGQLEDFPPGHQRYFLRKKL